VDVWQSKESYGLVFWTVDDCREGLRIAAIRQDENIDTRSDVIDPTIEQWAYLDVQPDLFGNFSGHTVLGCFAQLEFAARKLPLLALILEQDNPLGVPDHSLH
jgi:hypothetical protein